MVTKDISPIEQALRKNFDDMWSAGYDGRDIAFAYVKVAADVVRQERIADLDELRALLS